ncbi:oligosaccharide flippase family protein [Acinetobacter schindleri]|uniref:oligosaccharide flippase family protein n=1 Tax=Acinetobacter schindleri TaxID=108981 RepID=UPI003F55BB7C
MSKYRMLGIFKNRIFSNALWMMFEKFIAIFGLIFVNAYMAKYVGPENYGKIVFATTIFLFIQNISWFGAQNVYFKRMSEKPISGIKFALSTLAIRRFAFFIISILTLLYLYTYSDLIVFIFGVANFIASYYLISDIYTPYNNSQLISHINAISNVIGLVIALIVRFFQVYFEAHVYYMAIPIVLIALIPYCIRYIVFSRKKIKFSVSKKNKKKYSKHLFKTGGALFLSSVSIVVYTQISNILLAKYASYDELAYYNVAMTLGAAWSFINIALITSYFSKIFAEKNKIKIIKHYKEINYLVLFISIFVYLFFSILGEYIVLLLYGEKFIKASNLLGLVVIATFFAGLGTINYRYMMKLNAYKYLSVKMLFIALISIPLSYYLIKNYQVKGAAYCYIIIEFFSATIGNYFFNKGLLAKLHFSLLNPFGLKKKSGDCEHA